MPPAPIQPAPEGTQAALIEAGFHLFGHHSFAATSTRRMGRGSLGPAKAARITGTLLGYLDALLGPPERS